MILQLGTALLSMAILPGLALADPWKDESGHGRNGGDRGWGERFGEPPAWARGKGHWDGHDKHARPPHYRGRALGPPVWRDRRFAPQHVPPVPYGPVWRGDREDIKERSKERRERLKDLREQEREAFKEWREWQRERARYSPPPPPGRRSVPWR